MKVSRIAPVLAGIVLFSTPLLASAATMKFEVTGWLPYWRAASSTSDVMPHLSELTEINPFVFSLGQNGGIVADSHLDQEPWASLIAQAHADHVRVIPTIMTSSGSLLHALLSNTSSRIALEERIANFVRDNGFDGIEIDFEGKYASDKNYFSTFLKGLYERMGQKWVMCDIETRTPLDVRYYGQDVPKSAGIYSNDFTQINKYCDRVKFMAYDQQGVDQQLASQAASSSQLYAPVADPVWVKDVIDLAKQYISPDKILIGVPTYGYEYDVTAYKGPEYSYDIMWTFNPGYAKQIEQQYGVTPVRNSSGELMLTYLPAATSSMPVSANLSGLMVANAATAYADATNGHSQFRLLDWPDAVSVAQKIQLAKDLGVRGISIFKLDGGEDPGIWDVLKGVAGSPVQVATAPSGGSVAYSGAAMNPLQRNMGIGATGVDVYTLQRILNSNAATQIAQSGPGSPGNETETFGSLTKAAVRKFQSKYSIASPSNPAYGYVGPMTRAKLNSVLAAM